MVKRLFESVLIFLLPLLLIFAVYRFCLGFNPLNFKATIDIVSSSFSDSMDYFGEFARLQSQMLKETEFIASQRLEIVSSGFTPLDNIVNFLFSAIANIGVSVVHTGDMIRVSFNFVFCLIGDFFGAILALAQFLIDSSPYVVDPYFP